MSIYRLLTGDGAFYKDPNYEETTRRELFEEQLHKLGVYRCDTNNRAWSLVKSIFSVIFFPVFVYRILQSLIAKVYVLPASNPSRYRADANYASNCRKSIDLSSDWKIKRIAVKAGAYVIDAVLMGREATFDNGRWLLISNGNNQFYEESLESYPLRLFLSQLNSNAVFFNYPGVGASTGWPRRAAMSKAYKALLELLEDAEKGIGAKEIIAYGFSIGGGVQGDALVDHPLKDEIRYCFVKNSTFSDLATAAYYITNSKFVDFLLKVFAWNISSSQSSKALKATEIVMQTANVDGYAELRSSAYKVIHDGIIHPGASLANDLMSYESAGGEFLAEKHFLGIPEMHHEQFQDPTFLAQMINKILAKT